MFSYFSRDHWLATDRQKDSIGLYTARSMHYSTASRGKKNPGQNNVFNRGIIVISVTFNFCTSFRATIKGRSHYAWRRPVMELIESNMTLFTLRTSCIMWTASYCFQWVRFGLTILACMQAYRLNYTGAVSSRLCWTNVTRNSGVLRRS